MSNRYLEKIAQHSMYHEYDKEMSANGEEMLRKKMLIASAVAGTAAGAMAMYPKLVAPMLVASGVGAVGLGGLIYHNINKANERNIAFHKKNLSSPLEIDRRRAAKSLQSFKDRGYNID